MSESCLDQIEDEIAAAGGENAYRQGHAKIEAGPGGLSLEPLLYRVQGEDVRTGGGWEV